MHFGPETAQALLQYWRWTWGRDPVSLLSLAASAALLIRPQTRRPAAFALCCWLFLLSPMLPVTNHITDYYLTAPLCGAALLLATGIAAFPRTGLLFAALLTAIALPASRSQGRQNVDRGLNMLAVVTGVAQIQSAHPGKTILLTGVTDALFWSGVYDRPFQLAGAPATCLAPETAAALYPHPELFRPEDYSITTGALAAGLERQQILVYQVNGRQLLPVTWRYRLSLAGKQPGTPRIDFRNPVYSSFLGREWHEREGNFRWMPQSATVSLAGQGTAVLVHGFAASAQFTHSPELKVTAHWDETRLGTQTIRENPAEFTIGFALPPRRENSGRFRLTVNPITRVPGDPRELGLAVTSIEMK